MKPFFSIIIPTLNEENYLPKLLNDIAKQKKRSFEVIVIDAKSNDDTKTKAKQFSKKIPLKFFQVKKRNISYQRNFGAQKAKGSYLIFIDADIRIYPTFIKKLEAEVKKSNYLAYLTYLYPSGGTPTDRVLFNVYNFIVEVSLNTPKPFITPGVLIFQKDLFFFLGKFSQTERPGRNTLHPEDHELMLKAARSGVSAKLLRSIKVGSSLRRMQKEGRFKVLQKYTVSTLEMITKGKLEKNTAYEMGGHLYNVKGKSSKKKPAFFASN